MWCSRISIIVVLYTIHLCGTSYRKSAMYMGVHTFHYCGMAAVPSLWYFLDFLCGNIGVPLLWVVDSAM